MKVAELKKPLLSGVVFFSTVCALSVGYAAYTALAPVNSGDQLKRNDWNTMVSNLADFWAKLAPVSVSGNSVGIGTPTPLATLDVNGDFIRTIARWQGYGNDQTDNGVLAGRTFTMTKRHAGTGIRVSWNDNFRVIGTNTACSWEILFNGVSCSNPGPLRFDKYEGNTWSNRHDPNTVFGTCFWLPAGTVTVTTRVWPTPWYWVTDCYTGWSNGLVSIEGEEVR